MTWEGKCRMTQASPRFWYDETTYLKRGTSQPEHECRNSTLGGSVYVWKAEKANKSESSWQTVRPARRDAGPAGCPLPSAPLTTSVTTARNAASGPTRNLPPSSRLAQNGKPGPQATSSILTRSGCPTLRGLCEGWDATLSTPDLVLIGAIATELFKCAAPYGSAQAFGRAVEERPFRAAIRKAQAQVPRCRRRSGA